jgi:site-specific recombinase XerD
MLEAGIDQHTVQMLMGHSSAATTERYRHMTRTVVTATKSPLDFLIDQS